MAKSIILLENLHKIHEKLQRSQWPAQIPTKYLPNTSQKGFRFSQPARCLLVKCDCWNFLTTRWTISFSSYMELVSRLQCRMIGCLMHGELNRFVRNRSWPNRDTARLQCDGTCAENNFLVRAEQTSPYSLTAGMWGQTVQFAAGSSCLRWVARNGLTHSAVRFPFHFSFFAQVCAITE
jgi:hypothetical protein